jgi:hypothetical protein
MQKNLGKILSSGLIFFSVLVACKQAKPGIELNKMKVIVWDMFTADEWYNEWQIKDSTAIKKKVNIGIYKQVLQNHNITKEQFYKSYDYYLAHPAEMKVLIDSVEAYGLRKKQQFQATQKK